ncbi:hypothetical protein JFU57_30400 [Pseudomonas sp. TH07]|uniref:hypothetical protein n=1 Tax=Pseudomonas sp. TH07 TaxID=2796373 RepID=UPI001913D173|nr:hypothetical protein [Pseudomonas sp. TH07]MBK5542602.1 hypothetical protein [Pseudomonas sp. TH07]
MYNRASGSASEWKYMPSCIGDSGVDVLDLPRSHRQGIELRLIELHQREVRGRHTCTYQAARQCSINLRSCIGSKPSATAFNRPAVS